LSRFPGGVPICNRIYRERRCAEVNRLRSASRITSRSRHRFRIARTVRASAQHHGEAMVQGRVDAHRTEFGRAEHLRAFLERGIARFVLEMAADRPRNLEYR